MAAESIPSAAYWADIKRFDNQLRDGAQKRDRKMGIMPVREYIRAWGFNEAGDAIIWASLGLRFLPRSHIETGLIILSLGELTADNRQIMTKTFEYDRIRQPRLATATQLTSRAEVLGHGGPLLQALSASHSDVQSGLAVPTEADYEQFHQELSRGAAGEYEQDLS